ncbi:MAG: hypothetical protein KZQ95_05865 [Candidatus Thiodiazotropha sp. (ex Epidulcina cf. delphinae)]|nr:hypothetical protein [Candidatus Thiodiazotropha sp. (ex Epidulcina cf. delphinae)]
MSIQSDIGKWDEKSARDIGDIYNRHYQSPSFIGHIVEIISADKCQKGATWLLKHHLESRHQLSKSKVHEIFGKLTSLTKWESKLHILQCLPYLSIEKADKKKVELFLRNCLMESNKFVRAWAYNGFYELARQYPEYKEETKQFLLMAMKDEAPSVKSRIRNIMKSGF